jgi:hypothetical protein
VPQTPRARVRQIEALFVQVLVMAREMGVLKLGTVALDGTSAYSDGYQPGIPTQSSR